MVHITALAMISRIVTHFCTNARLEAHMALFKAQVGISSMKNEVCLFIKELCSLRRQHVALRRGRQYLREVFITGQDGDFFYPHC